MQPVKSGDKRDRRAMAFAISSSIQEKRDEIAAVVAVNKAVLATALQPLQTELDALEADRDTLFPPAQRMAQWLSASHTRTCLHHKHARLIVVRSIATRTSDDAAKASSDDGDDSMSS